jgi:hypothetical protein
MAGYADPELLIATWLHGQLGCQMRADPRLPDRWSFDAPIGMVQRGQGFGDDVLTLDTAILDIDFYAKVADHARDYAERARHELRVNLPLHVFDGGVFVTGVRTVSAPCWAPDPGVYRRTAAYQVTLHGIV